MLGAPPALANTRFPVASSDVIGREPPEARATDKNREKKKHVKDTVNIIMETQITNHQSSTESYCNSVGKSTALH
jgi:hypothetical protein